MFLHEVLQSFQNLRSDHLFSDEGSMRLRRANEIVLYWLEVKNVVHLKVFTRFYTIYHLFEKFSIFQSF